MGERKLVNVIHKLKNKLSELTESRGDDGRESPDVRTPAFNETTHKIHTNPSFFG